MHGRAVDIEVVEAVEAKLRDVNAAHAVIVSSGGFTKSAIRRGNELIQLTLLEYDQVVDEHSDTFGTVLPIATAVRNSCGPSTRLMAPVPAGLCTNTGNVYAATRSTSFVKIAVRNSQSQMGIRSCANARTESGGRFQNQKRQVTLACQSLRG